MKYRWYVLTMSLLAGIAPADETSAPSNLHQIMTKVVAPETQVVWDVSNKALENEGTPGGKLNAGDWAKIAAAAGAVKDSSHRLATAQRVLAASPGVKIDGEGAPGAFGAKQVQAAIDANPAAFHAFAQQLATVMEDVIVSAQHRDVAKLTDDAGRLDQACEDCHLQFWYPTQAAAH
jgi:cytochrome c556